jgi:hypothetical protein
MNRLFHYFVFSFTVSLIRHDSNQSLFAFFLRYLAETNLLVILRVYSTEREVNYWTLVPPLAEHSSSSYNPSNSTGSGFHLVKLLSREDVLVNRKEVTTGPFGTRETEGTELETEMMKDAMNEFLTKTFHSICGQPTDYNPFLFSRGKLPPTTSALSLPPSPPSITVVRLFLLLLLSLLKMFIHSVSRFLDHNIHLRHHNKHSNRRLSWTMRTTAMNQNREEKEQEDISARTSYLQPRRILLRRLLPTITRRIITIIIRRPPLQFQSFPNHPTISLTLTRLFLVTSPLRS